ncbi:MarC family protein [Bradymonadales bacterium TMQ1]|uniref:UPF0056 membrane protein n=1 Tax=Lujinxingia sediminis TaxID=2480984 RepID=A0ABY0CPF5_9DELT|nr:MarC family protein [Lujinxingia sediminis]RVU41502.1 MarC family protein [Lujinxingia sediminis]TXC68490.1 MarC family protein [Bradymonadales bacterium TMQ1]
MESTLQAIITMLSLVNPAVCLAMFAAIESGQPGSIQRKDATQIALATLIILGTSALMGTRVLEIFGVSVDAFSVTGGAVLVGIGAAMLMGRQQPAGPSPGAPDAANPHAEPSAHQAALGPLILFAGGPGPITGVITLSAQSQQNIPWEALIAVGITALVLWVVLFVSARRAPETSSDADQPSPTADDADTQSFYRDIATRFMGLIIIAMGVQIGLSGLQNFFGSAA